jgi:hypothetical protein
VDQAVAVDEEGSVHLAEVAQVAVVLDVERVAQGEQRTHPAQFLVVGDHRGQALVLVDHRAGPAAHAAVSAAGGGGVHHERAFVVGGGSPVHREQVLVGVPPGVLVLHECHPDLVGRERLNGAVDERVGEAAVRADPVTDAALLVAAHRAPSGLALGLADAQDEDHLAVLADHVLDESVGWFNFQTFGTPSELWSRRGVAAADQVDPEGVFELRREAVRLDGQLLFGGRGPHRVQRPVRPCGDDGILHQRVRADDVHRLGALLHGQAGQRHPDQHEDQGAVLASGIANTPRDVISTVELADLVEQLLDDVVHRAAAEGLGLDHLQGEEDGRGRRQGEAPSRG